VRNAIAMAAVIAVLFTATAGVASAEDKADKARFGYVNVRKVFAESKAGKHYKVELDKLTKQKKDQLAREEQKLKDMQAAYEKEQLTLTEAQKKERQRDFQQKAEAYQKLTQEAQREVNQKDAEYTQKAMAEIGGIVGEIARQEKLMLVFEKNQMPVLYAEDGPDLTDTVIKKYDAKAGK